MQSAGGSIVITKLMRCHVARYGAPNETPCMQVTGSDPAQHSAAGAGAGPTIRDEATVWESIAAAQYKLDGNDAGWDSEESDEETPEDKYIKVRQASHMPHSRAVSQ
jgi:hypothetical protein